MCTYADIAHKINPNWPACDRTGSKPVDRPDLDPNKNYKLTDDTTCTICDVCETRLFGTSLKVDTSTGSPAIPLDAVYPKADKWVVSLVAIRQDRHYLPKSLVFTIHKTPALSGFRTPLTKYVIKKTQHLTSEEYSEAKKRPPKDADGSPTMGHTYVVMSLFKDNKLLADYSFGYFPSGVENPDKDAHATLSNEERLRIDFTTTKDQWDAAFKVINKWRTAHQAMDYDIMGKNCTAFTREVINAAGVTFPGEKILSLGKRGIGKVDTPNKTYKALEIGGMAYDPKGVNAPTPQPGHVVDSITSKNSQEYMVATLQLNDDEELSDDELYTFAE